MVGYYRRFGTKCRFHFQGSSWPIVVISYKRFRTNHRSNLQGYLVLSGMFLQTFRVKLSVPSSSVFLALSGSFLPTFRGNLSVSSSKVFCNLIICSYVLFGTTFRSNLQGFFALSGKFLQTFRDNLSVPSSDIKVADP
jgi:hypothetical protein